jgi:hypothetical protein
VGAGSSVTTALVGTSVAGAGSGALVGVDAGAHAPRTNAAMTSAVGTKKNRFIFFSPSEKYFGCPIFALGFQSGKYHNGDLKSLP